MKSAFAALSAYVAMAEDNTVLLQVKTQKHPPKMEFEDDYGEFFDDTTFEGDEFGDSMAEFDDFDMEFDPNMEFGDETHTPVAADEHHMEGAEFGDEMDYTAEELIDDIHDEIVPEYFEEEEFDDFFEEYGDELDELIAFGDVEEFEAVIDEFCAAGDCEVEDATALAEAAFEDIAGTEYMHAAVEEEGPLSRPMTECEEWNFWPHWDCSSCKDCDWWENPDSGACMDCCLESDKPVLHMNGVHGCEAEKECGVNWDDWMSITDEDWDCIHHAWMGAWPHHCFWPKVKDVFAPHPELLTDHGKPIPTVEQVEDGEPDNLCMIMDDCWKEHEWDWMASDQCFCDGYAVTEPNREDSWLIDHASWVCGTEDDMTFDMNGEYLMSQKRFKALKRQGTPFKTALKASGLGKHLNLKQLKKNKILKAAKLI